MEDVIVSSVTPGGSDGGETKLIKTVAFAYGKIKWEYTPIDHTGKSGSTTDRTWNLKTNKQERLPRFSIECLRLVPLLRARWVGFCVSGILMHLNVIK